MCHEDLENVAADLIGYQQFSRLVPGMTKAQCVAGAERGTFPPIIRFSPRSREIFVREADLREWLNERYAALDAAPSRTRQELAKPEALNQTTRKSKLSVMLTPAQAQQQRAKIKARNTGAKKARLTEKAPR